MVLPEGVDEDRIRARYENGVLEVTIEGATAVREPRRIQVEGAADRQGGTSDVKVSSGQRTTPEGAREATTPAAETTRQDEAGRRESRLPWWKRLFR